MAKLAKQEKRQSGPRFLLRFYAFCVCGVFFLQDPLQVTLPRPGSLTLAMCQLLNEIQETKKGVVTPRELFTQVCKKYGLKKRKEKKLAPVWVQ